MSIGITEIILILLVVLLPICSLNWAFSWQKSNLTAIR